MLITFWIGGRELDDARHMLRDVVARLIDKPLFVSDELAHYQTVLAELFHELVYPEPTGRPGRPRSPERILDPDLVYATVHKTREGGRVVRVERRVIYGCEAEVARRLEDSPSHTVNTAYAERSNLDWRLWDAHLTRKASTHARARRWLRAKFAICVACYDFVRPHATLSRGSDRVYRAKTPAMAAAVTDHPWTILELLTHPKACQ